MQCALLPSQSVFGCFMLLLLAVVCKVSPQSQNLVFIHSATQFAASSERLKLLHLESALRHPESEKSPDCFQPVYCEHLLERLMKSLSLSAIGI